MSRENMELARWTFTSDPTRFFSLLDEDIELDARRYAELPGATLTGRGREVVERFCREFWGTWAEYSAAPREFIDAGDHVVVEVHERGEGKGSGVPFQRTHIQVPEPDGCPSSRGAAGVAARTSFPLAQPSSQTWSLNSASVIGPNGGPRARAACIAAAKSAYGPVSS